MPDPAFPATQVFFAAFTFLPFRLGAFTYLALCAATLLVPLWLLLSPLKPSYRVVFLTIAVVLTTPFVSVLDRGNVIAIGVGLVAWALWAWRSERWVWCGIFLVAAIAIKETPVALLIVPFALRRYRFTALVAASVVASNLIAILIVPGGFFRNLRAMLPAVLSQQNWYPASEKSYSWGLFSVIPKTAGLLIGPTAANHLYATTSILLWLPSVLYLGCLYIVIRRGRVPQWCWGPLSLASIQLILPLSFAYATLWAPVAAVWYARGYLVETHQTRPNNEGSVGWVTLRIALLLALTVSLAPSVFTIAGSGNFDTPLTEYLSPVILLITMLVAVILSFRPVEAEGGETLFSQSGPALQIDAGVTGPILEGSVSKTGDED
jgi:hypothetical protein